MSNTIINTNVTALNSHRALTSVGNRQARSAERLSTGQRINRASDDAAGLAISEKMRSQIRGLDQATRNSQDGISLIQTAEGALEEIQSIVQRMRELTVQASNDTATTTDREAIQAEIDLLIKEVTEIAERTSFNGTNLLNGDADELFIQTGANAGQGLTITIEEMNAEALGIEDINVVGEEGGSGSDISDQLEALDEALEAISTQRAELGANQNRLEHTINNLQVSSENLSAANSRIRDTDMAAEMMALTQANVLQQAATSMLAQANQAPQSVLQLLN